MKSKEITLDTITQNYKLENLKKLNVDLLEQRSVILQRPKKNAHSRYYSRLSFKSYKPVLSQKKSSFSEATQSSSSRARFRLSPSQFSYKGYQSSFPFYLKSSRPSTAYK
jgi:hypothetical protein